MDIISSTYEKTYKIDKGESQSEWTIPTHPLASSGIAMEVLWRNTTYHQKVTFTSADLLKSLLDTTSCNALRLPYRSLCDRQNTIKVPNMICKGHTISSRPATWYPTINPGSRSPNLNFRMQAQLLHFEISNDMSSCNLIGNLNEQWW